MSPNWLERATFARAWDPRVVCVITLGLVFLCGAAAGKALYYARIQKELDLTPAQTEQMQSILNDLWQYYRMVINDSRVRVEQVLTEPQRKKFERILQEHQPR